MELTEELTLSAAAEALHVNPRTLQSWAQFIPGERLKGGGSKGIHRRFSFFALMQVAVAKAMIDATSGTDLKTAFAAAQRFAHTGRGATGFIGEPATGKPTRLPSHPYHYGHGETYLLSSGDRSAVVLMPKGISFAKYQSIVWKAFHARREAFVCVDVGEVFVRVCMSLDMKPWDILDAAYPAEVAALRAKGG